MLIQQVPVPPVPPEIVTVSTAPPPWVTLTPGHIVAISIVAIVAAAAVLFPLFRAIARRIERGSAADTEELEDLRARISLLEEQLHRLPELEERLDFTERMLAAARDSSRLKEG